MSRSRKKTPICGIAKSVSEKQDKKISHRKTRAKEKRAMLANHDESTPPLHHREAMNPCIMAKDGKMWFDQERLPKLMRK